MSGILGQNCETAEESLKRVGKEAGPEQTQIDCGSRLKAMRRPLQACLSWDAL